MKHKRSNKNTVQFTANDLKRRNRNFVRREGDDPDKVMNTYKNRLRLVKRIIYYAQRRKCKFNGVLIVTNSLSS